MKLLKRYLSLHLKICLEYKSSFILTIIAQALKVGAELMVVLSLFSKFKLFDKYDINLLLLAFSIFWAGFSFFEVFLRGWDQFDHLVVRGEFDTLLIRPRSLFLMVTGTEIDYQKIGELFVSLGLLIYSCIKVIGCFDILKILLVIICVMAAILFALSYFTIAAAISFKTIQGLEILNVFTYGSRQIAQYPIDLFGKTIKNIFTFVIPVTFINYYPLKFISGTSNNFIYFLCPFAVLILFLFSRIIFKIGLKSYQGTGS
jgi:ABC-2 type transport system permease protein